MYGDKPEWQKILKPVAVQEQRFSVLSNLCKGKKNRGILTA